MLRLGLRVREVSIEIGGVGVIVEVERFIAVTVRIIIALVRSFLVMGIRKGFQRF
jgi:hypothetical protein